MPLMSMAVLNIHCEETTKEIDRDEPYVLVTAADISNLLVPAVDVVKYGPWSDVKKGRTYATLARLPGLDDKSWKIVSKGMVLQTPFWGLNGQPKAITNTQSVIFVVSLVEHDASADASATRELAKLAAVGSLAASSTLAYQTRVDKLLTDIKGALQVPTGAPNFDDPIGTKHLPLVIGDLSGAAGTTRNKTLSFAGEGAKYTVTCQIKYS